MVFSVFQTICKVKAGKPNKYSECTISNKISLEFDEQSSSSYIVISAVDIKGLKKRH